MFSPLHKTRMLRIAPDERVVPNAAQPFGQFALVFLAASIARTVISVIAAEFLPAGNASAALLVDLFATVTTVAAVLLWCLLFERRTLFTLGLIRRGAVGDYLVGMIGGVALFGGAVGLCVLTGTAAVTRADAPPAVGLLLLFFAAFLIQGMSEELLCRSFLMVTLSRKLPLWACALTNAAMFSGLHMFNPGVTPIALVNIFLFGVFASLLTLRRGSIWMAAAVHSLWNFAQGNLFGIPVSGIAGMPAPLSTTVPTDGVWWQELINGGAFGIEGGFAATAVLVAGIFILMLLPTKRSEVVEEPLIKTVAE